jgi:hypothetical protein
MNSKLGEKTTICATTFFVVSLGALALCDSASVAFAQEPIRIETNQVLVPVFVEDERRERRMEIDATSGYRALLAGDMKRFNEFIESLVIPNLTAADFQLFDDGKEQKIQSVSYERSLYWDVRDNKGHHTEYIGIGGGKWSSTEWQPDLVADFLSPPHYVISYPLPESPEGSCHKIQIKVLRRNALVAARSEYCNTHHPASDSLNGSKLGGRLEGELATPTSKNVGISVLAIPFYAGNEVARVHVAVDWSGKSVKELSRVNGILGVLLNADGSLVARFSDLADRAGSWGLAHWELQPDDLPNENRYDTQVSLPPGKYELRVALGDGTKFGWAAFPFTVEGLTGKELAVSQVSLCKIISDVSQNASKLPGAWTVKLPDSYVALVSNETEFKPTGDTRFKLGDSLYAYFEVYASLSERQPPENVGVQIRIIDLKTGKQISDPQPISVTPYLKPGSAIIPIGRGIDISKLPKGSYRLDVRAIDSTKKSTDWRSADFKVE